MSPLRQSQAKLAVLDLQPPESCPVVPLASAEMADLLPGEAECIFCSPRRGAEEGWLLSLYLQPGSPL